MCSTGWGLQGHSCPITPWFINHLQLACMRRLFCCVGCYLQPERQAVCISGYTSLGCVWGNEMALFVMYLPSPFAEACLRSHLISPLLPWCINWQKEWERECWSQSVIVLYIFTTTTWQQRMISSPSLRIFSVSHTFYCWYTMSTPRWISYLQIQETKQRYLILLFCYSSYFPISPHLYPPLCLQSSTRWRWCAPYVTSTLTICMWAGTSLLTMAPLLVEPCSTPSSATSMQLKSLSCSFMVSMKWFVSIHAFGADTSWMLLFCIEVGTLRPGGTIVSPKAKLRG